MQELNWKEYYLNNAEELSSVAVPYARIVTKSCNAKTTSIMCNAGFIFADRMLEVTVPLKKNNDFNKNIRMNIETASQNELKRIQEIAEESFQDDSRFYISLDENREILAKSIIYEYLQKPSEAFVCKYKNDVIGFAKITFEKNHDNTPFFYLVAVDPQYRLTGGALSLYSYICQYFKEKNYTKIMGRISSKNTPVMNIYSMLGASFNAPIDVYIRSGE